MKWRLTAALGFTLLLALILRVPDLDQRPFHNDEAVNAVMFQQLLEEGVYRYDPNEYHGPLLSYATLGLARLMGWPAFAASTEADFRWVSLLSGVALIPLLWLTRDALGCSGTRWAGLLTAVSPSLVFFHRDYIHESLLVTGTFLLIGCVWRYWRSPDWKWAAAVGLALAWISATKETFVLNLASMGLAAMVLTLWSRSGSRPAAPLWRASYGHILVALAVWLGIAALFFSSFGANPTGPLDAVKAYLPYLHRAGGESLHIHPAWFYAQRLFWQNSTFTPPWTELGALLLAVVAVRAALVGRGLGDANAWFVRWLALYTLLLFVMYSLIPYKTPWCILGVSHGMALLAGIGLAVLWRGAWRSSQRVLVLAVTLLIPGQLTWQAWALSHTAVTSRHNPWAYADTVPDVRNLVELIEEMAAVDPEGKGMHIQVICEEDDYWPLPYYLRDFSRVGWWSAPPPAPLAPVLVVSTGVLNNAELEATHVSAGWFQLRHGVFRSCFVERGLWEKFLRTRASDGF